MRVYLIARADQLPQALLAVRALPRGGAGVQLRDPSLTPRQLLSAARGFAQELAADQRTGSPAPLLVNDRADVALSAGCGVHLPARGLSPEDARELGVGLVGASTHSPGEGVGADFLVFGPVFDTPGKGPAQGLPKLREAVLAARGTPVYALGGVTPENAWQCMESGARGVACIRSVLDAADPAAAAVRLWQAVTQ